MDSKWSTVVTTLKMGMARVAVLEKCGQKVGFCIFPINVRRAKVMYISLTVAGVHSVTLDPKRNNIPLDFMNG
jgi:hypothetical protein